MLLWVGMLAGTVCMLWLVPLLIACGAASALMSFMPHGGKPDFPWSAPLVFLLLTTLATLVLGVVLVAASARYHRRHDDGTTMLSHPHCRQCGHDLQSAFQMHLSICPQCGARIAL